MKSIFDTQTRTKILSRIDSLNQESKAEWGQMTVAQMVKHCALCEEYYHGNFVVNRSPLGRLIGKMVLRKMIKDDQSMLQKNAPTSPQFRVNNEIGNLDLEKEKWKSLIEQYASFDKEYFTHWFFGKMSKEQLGQFIYKHCDHHLRQFRS
jgi:hypothetical protein